MRTPCGEPREEEEEVEELPLALQVWADAQQV